MFDIHRRSFWRHYIYYFQKRFSFETLDTLYVSYFVEKLKRPIEKRGLILGFFLTRFSVHLDELGQGFSSRSLFDEQDPRPSPLSSFFLFCIHMEKRRLVETPRLECRVRCFGQETFIKILSEETRKKISGYEWTTKRNGKKALKEKKSKIKKTKRER